jgi:hypothetical protein
MRRVNRKRPIDYILPFLIILGLGVVIVLGLQLWKNFEKQGKADAYFYIASGKARLLQYGESTWNNAFSGTKLLVGDSLKTSSIGKAVLAFFNGTLIRIGNDTAITLTDLSKDTEKERIVVTMDNGLTWINAKKSPGVKQAEYEVRTSHMLVRANGTVFEVEKNSAEIVRVIEGNVNVDVLISNNGKERVAETISVGVGQEIILDDATLKAFEDNQSPSVLMALNEQFKTTDWYSWNVEEDRNPTSYDNYLGDASGTTAASQSDDVSGLSQQGTQQGHTQEGGLTQSGTQETQEITGETISSGAPVINKPVESERTVTGPLTISGTAPDDAVKMIVDQVVSGKSETYTLAKFKAGDTAFSYNVSEKFGNLAKGENIYTFYAVNKDGDKSEGASITLTFDKTAVNITDALTAPVVKTFNGAVSSTVTVDTVQVAGEIVGAEKVVVNGYTLSKFEPGSTVWNYTAKESLQNLKSGVNEYEVYGIDTNGNKSAAVKFTITYDKPVSTVTGTVTTTSATQASSQQGAVPTYGF